MLYYVVKIKTLLRLVRQRKGRTPKEERWDRKMKKRKSKEEKEKRKEERLKGHKGLLKYIPSNFNLAG